MTSTIQSGHGQLESLSEVSFGFTIGFPFLILFKIGDEGLVNQFQILNRTGVGCKSLPDQGRQVEVGQDTGPDTHTKQSAKESEFSQVQLSVSLRVDQPFISVFTETVGLVSARNKHIQRF